MCIQHIKRCFESLQSPCVKEQGETGGCEIVCDRLQYTPLQEVGSRPMGVMGVIGRMRSLGKVTRLILKKRWGGVCIM